MALRDRFMNRHYIGVMGLLILGVAAMPASALQEEGRDAPYVAFDLRPNMDGGLGVRYYDSVPNGGWPEECKKEYLLLRKVSLGKSAATIVSTQESAVSNSYYIGVFEVTRYQYALVMGEQPNSVDNPIHPIDQVSWQQLRSVPDEGYVESNDWPLWREVDESSFFGRLRKNLSIDSFDLPTEFQWSYACSYGMTEKAVGIDAEGNEVFDRSRVKEGNGLFDVGRHFPNALGLYDMFANASEWCLDRVGAEREGLYIPGPCAQGVEFGKIIEVRRILRSGTQATCGKWSRFKYVQHVGWNGFGFRVVLNATPSNLKSR